MMSQRFQGYKYCQGGESFLDSQADPRTLTLIRGVDFVSAGREMAGMDPMYRTGATLTSEENE
jgi:hypothetical protein